MPAQPNLTSRAVTILLLVLVWSCAKAPVKIPEGTFYVATGIAYLRDAPRYEANILGQMYRGDQVVRTTAGEADWWQVRHSQSGQTGWIKSELLSPEPVPTVYSYVSVDSLPLRDCPRQNCSTLQILFRGDRILKVEDNAQGWCRVLVPESRSLGWVTADALSEQAPPPPGAQPQKAKSYYYVAVRKLILQAKPSRQSETVRILKFNEQVVKIEENPKGWFKVRHPASGAVGWVSGRYLQTLPRVSAPGKPPSDTELQPFKEREEPMSEPEFM